LRVKVLKPLDIKPPKGEQTLQAWISLEDERAYTGLRCQSRGRMEPRKTFLVARVTLPLSERLAAKQRPTVLLSKPSV
jgi:hypothetical protein